MKGCLVATGGAFSAFCAVVCAAAGLGTPAGYRPW
jgi:hypothetical protein